MCYRKYVVRTMIVIMSIILLAGMAGAQDAIDVDGTLYKNLSKDAKLSIISELGLDITLENFKGIRFDGQMTSQGMEVRTMETEMAGDPEVIQTLTGRNCGGYEDMVHLTVTESKTHAVTTSTESHWSVNGTVEFGVKAWLIGETKVTIGGEYGRSEGEQKTDETTTSWDQSVDVVVPPHQSLTVNFMAYKQTVTAPYEINWLASGPAVALTDPVPPIVVSLNCNDDRERTYTGNIPIPNFGDSSCDNNVRSITVRGPENLKIEMFEHGDYGGEIIAGIERGHCFSACGIIESGFKFTKWSSEQILLQIEDYDDIKAILERDAFAIMKHEPERIAGDAKDHVISYLKQRLPKGYVREDWKTNVDNFEKDYSDLIEGYLERTRTHVLLDQAKSNTSSLRITDLNRPHACLYDQENFLGHKRCFNIGHDLDFWNSGNVSSFNDKARAIKVSEVKATLYTGNGCTTDRGYLSQVFTQSSVLPTELQNNSGGVTCIKIEPAGTTVRTGEQTFLIEDYLDPDERTFFETGTYTGVDQVQGYFERGISHRLGRDACCKGSKVMDSIDCSDESWASTMTGFVVYIKTSSTAGASGQIKQNGIPCGEECTISAPLTDLPILWKIEAVPNDGSQLAGWTMDPNETPIYWLLEDSTGSPILSGKHKPLPGDTIYAVFEPSTE